MISTRRSARLILPCRFATAIDTTSSPILRSSYVRLSAPIYLTSCQTLQISTSHAFLNSLALIFHKCLFYTLSDVFAFIQDFAVDQDRIYVYEDVLKQLRNIFELGSAFMSSLVKAIKKDKSWVLASWSQSEVDQLMSPLLRHVRANCIGKNCWEGAFKTINQHWGSEIGSFFEVDKSRKKFSDN